MAFYNLSINPKNKETQPVRNVNIGIYQNKENVLVVNKNNNYHNNKYQLSKFLSQSLLQLEITSYY